MAFSNTTEPGVRHFIPPLKDVGFRAAKPAVRAVRVAGGSRTAPKTYRIAVYRPYCVITYRVASERPYGRRMRAPPLMVSWGRTS